MRNFGLDLLRCISIWFVIIEHAGIEVTGISRLKIGTIGVEIFFVISGFLIGGILLRDIDKGNPLFITLKNFWIRRWFRILPLYYGVLIFQYIFIDNTVGKNIIYYFLFLQKNARSRHSEKKINIESLMTKNLTENMIQCQML